jgi:hypothetical protein
VASIPTFDNGGVDPAQASLNRLQQIIGALDSTLRLPNSPRAFAVYLLGLSIVLVGAFLHVYVAAQIMQAEFTLNQLREEYRSIEQQNGDIIFQISRDTNMARLYERVKAMGYVPVQEREFIFAPNEMVVTAPEGVENIASSTHPAATSENAPLAQAALEVTPASTLGSSLGGQVGRWEEFWQQTLRAATGSVAAAPNVPAEQTPSKTTGSTQRSDATPNFWAVWWEQASEQGEKLLDQIRGQ